MKDLMSGWIDSFPDMLEDAWKSAAQSPAADAPRITFVAGMGGSVMAGALGAAILSGAGRMILPWPQPQLPPFFSPGQDGLIVVSYSGTTWEALNVFEEARRYGASPGVVTSGGDLAERAAAAGCPLFSVPGGMAPRAALPWLLAGVLRYCGFDDAAGIRGAAEALRREAVAPGPGRDPRILAERLHGRLPILLPVGPALESVAIRWRNQILENAEQTAFVSPLPEMAHNEIMGWGWMKESGIRAAIVVILQDPPSAPPWNRLLEGLRGEAALWGHEFLVVPPPQCSDRLSALLVQILLGDRLSLHLAEKRGVDPVAIEAIRRLRRSPGKEPTA